MTNNRRFPRAWLNTLVALLALLQLAVARADEDDSYRYRLEEGKGLPVCQHMGYVYNNKFRRPWDFRDLPIDNPPFPRLPGVAYDSRKALDLRFSAFPRAPEFDAVPWMEGRKEGREGLYGPSPILLADVDIDNDGTTETLIKTSFMRGYSPAHNSAPGGEDQIWIVDKGSLDLSKPLARSGLYQQRGELRPALLAPATFEMPVRSIRPFIYDGEAFLSVYEQDVSHEGKRWRTTEAMWVMKYRGGGQWKAGTKREPLQIDRVCRFRMIPRKR